MAGPVNVRWVTHPELSVAHAVCTVATGAACTDAKTEQLLVDHVSDINTRLITSSIDVRAFWQRYRLAMIEHEDSLPACTEALLAAGCNEFQVEQTGKAISSLLSECRISFNGRFPKIREQLGLRARPLTERWDTVGAGLLKEIERQVWGQGSPGAWWPARVDGLLIQPIRGGDGGIDPPSKKFWIEAVLTDVDPSVPEVLRIAWLLTRLTVQSNLPLGDPRNSEQPAMIRAWSLGAIPIVLSAARELDLVRGPGLPIKTAVALWDVGTDSEASRLELWWRDSQQTAQPFLIALKELSRLLQAKGDPDEAGAG